MLRIATIMFAGLSALLLDSAATAQASPPLGPPGLTALYRIAEPNLAASVIETLSIDLGGIDEWNGIQGQWLHLKATKKNSVSFETWLLCEKYPSESLAEAQREILRYVLKREVSEPVEFRHGVADRAVLPTSGAWTHLLPRSETNSAVAPDAPFPETAIYLGLRYSRTDLQTNPPLPAPTHARIVPLRPDLLVGVPHNTRQADETRRYDESDYEYIPLTPDDYTTMIDAGLNCFVATPENVSWLDDAGVFYWGVGGADLVYPECLYQPQYIGPALFLDEPAVTTRDSKLRPRLRDEPAFRHAITPQDALEAFKEHYAEVIENGAPPRLLAGLADRDDVDIGSMDFQQANLYTWETMVSTAAHQLLYDPVAPSAIVFEPPGRVGARRMLPAMNMSYGCQIPVTNTNHFIDIIIGFVRGAARSSGKEWGISIYGGVDTTEAPAFFSRAYEMGATRYFFWDSAQLACVPFGEVLTLSRHVKEHARSYPDRDLDRLRRAADVAILLPPGYNLGHVHMGRGILWGLSELNLERRNREGVTYRTVMGNFFTEIEYCIRQGIAFDLLWDLPDLKLEGYRQVVRIREDGKIQVLEANQATLLDDPRIPERPAGEPPQLRVEVSATQAAAPCVIAATAHITEGADPVYYSPTPDAQGVHHNQGVMWELYGPADEDYAHGTPAIEASQVASHEDGAMVVQTTIHVDKPGAYRLRAATTDLAGRSTVVWTELNVTP